MPANGIGTRTSIPGRRLLLAPVLRWPEGARVALAGIVDLEHWDWEVPTDTPVAVSPMGGPEGLWTGNQPQFPDIGGYGNHEYGNRVGIFRSSPYWTSTASHRPSR